MADKQFKRGDFVIEYSGDLIEISEAKKREEMYATDQNAGCYMYYFEHNNHKYWYVPCLCFQALHTDLLQLYYGMG